MTVQNIPDSLPCNPALLPLASKPRLAVQGMISNGYATLDRARRLLSGQIDQKTIDDLFSEARVLQIEGNAEIDMVTPHLAAAYTPVNVKHFSVVRNEANPDIEISAVEERSFVLQTGWHLGHRLYVGITGKTLSRRFVKNRLQLVDLGTDEGKDSLKPRTQSAVLFTPSVTYFFPGAWKPRVAVMVANLGSAHGDDELAEPVDVQGGTGVTIPLGWAEIDLGLDYRSLSYEEGPGDRFHLGGVLRFGAMSLLGGVDSYGFSGGVFYGLDQINADILFSTTQSPWSPGDYYANTVYLQAGWQI